MIPGPRTNKTNELNLAGLQFEPNQLDFHSPGVKDCYLHVIYDVRDQLCNTSVLKSPQDGIAAVDKAMTWESVTTKTNGSMKPGKDSIFPHIIHQFVCIKHNSIWKAFYM